MKSRKAIINRKTKETQSKGTLNVDGSGKTKIKTPIGLLDHMLELFAFHGFFDMELQVKGDTHVDVHHTSEDIGIVLGKAFKEALGDKAGIRRFGTGFAPMEDTLGQTTIDISGRGHLKIISGAWGATGYVHIPDSEGHSFQHLEHLIDSFAKQLGANIIINIQRSPSSADLHT